MSPAWIKSCFGWLHTGTLQRGGDVAVLLCPALSRDALDSHQSLRLLADELAAAGYPALRFFYPGTGDSGEISGETWGAWQRSVHDAADWLRQTTGAKRVVFCGLRIGGALAALAAAARPDAAGLILLAPVLRGHSYMRQLGIEAQLKQGAPAPDGGLDFQELHLSARTVGLISKADLRQLQFPAGFPIAVFAQSQPTLLSHCADRWRQSGARVATAGFDGLDAMLRHNLAGAGEAPDFAGVMAWLRAAIPPCPAAAPALAPAAPLRLPGCRETPLRFGPGNHLFGMLCQPDDRPAQQVVLITNAGRDPHYSFARFSVELARHLAATGIASLRFDFAGLGDSAARPGDERVFSPVFETDRTPDISAALDVLAARGYRQFAVQGLCAGAYHGLHGAVADPRISTLLLINLPVFAWRAGDTFDFFHQRHLAPRHFMAQLRELAWWIRLFRGDVPLAKLARAQSLRQSQRIRRAVLARLGRPSAAQAAMATLSARGARALFLYAPAESGIDAFEQEFGPDGAQLRRFAGASMQVVPGFDHLLSAPAMRRHAIALMLQFLRPPGAAVGATPSRTLHAAAC